jgi:hypothetical protein
MPPTNEVIMLTTVFPVHNGFEIQTLIYINREPAGTLEQGYGVSVRIFRAGSEPDSSNSRLFRLSGARPYEALGDARRAGVMHGCAIIDGRVTGQSVADL